MLVTESLNFSFHLSQGTPRNTAINLGSTRKHVLCLCWPFSSWYNGFHWSPVVCCPFFSFLSFPNHCPSLNRLSFSPFAATVHTFSFSNSSESLPSFIYMLNLIIFLSIVFLLLFTSVPFLSLCWPMYSLPYIFPVSPSYPPYKISRRSVFVKNSSAAPSYSDSVRRLSFLFSGPCTSSLPYFFLILPSQRPPDALFFSQYVFSNSSTQVLFRFGSASFLSLCCPKGEKTEA